MNKATRLLALAGILSAALVGCADTGKLVTLESEFKSEIPAAIGDYKLVAGKVAKNLGCAGTAAGESLSESASGNSFKQYTASFLYLKDGKPTEGSPEVADCTDIDTLSHGSIEIRVAGSAKGESEYCYDHNDIRACSNDLHGRHFYVNAPVGGSHSVPGEELHSLLKTFADTAVIKHVE